MKQISRLALLVLAAPFAVLAAETAPLTWSRKLLRQKPEWFASATGRAGYDYHGTWPASLLEKDHPAWRVRLAALPASPSR